MSEQKPLLSLSLDLDNKWAYMKTQGETGWESYPSYLDEFVSIALPIFKKYDLKITVFIVGQDAALDKNADAIKAIAEEGHELGNHSFSHEPWFHLYDESDIIREIETTAALIESLTGQVPTGFRGPGFSDSPTMLNVLAERGYAYDASTFPTFLGPLARLYFFSKSKNLSPEEKEKRMQLFGSFSDGFQSLRPHTLDLPAKSMIEIPVTTMPVFKLPFHQSYLAYLMTYSRRLSDFYRWFAISMCKGFGVTPSFLLHPVDFLGHDKVAGMDFFPGMNFTTQEKTDSIERLLEFLLSRYKIVNMATHCEMAKNS